MGGFLIKYANARRDSRAFEMLFVRLFDPVELLVDAERLLFRDCSSCHTYPAADAEKNGIFPLCYG